MMATQKFSKTEAIRFGWNTMRCHLGFFIGLFVLVGIISFVPGFLTALTSKSAPVISIIAYVVSWILGIVFAMGFIRIGLRFCDGEKAGIGDLFSSFPLFFKYLFGSILYGLIVFVGLILLIIPGIIWGIKFQFWSYFVVDKGLGPIEALKRSSAITKGTKWNLFLFGLLLWLINMAGILVLFIGLFATVPTAMVAMAFVYRKLAAHAEGIQTSEENLRTMHPES